MPEEQARGRQGAVQTHNAEMKKIVSDLVLQARQEDPSGSFMNFGQRKAYTTYDPYNWESQYASIRYEDEVKLRASIVIDVQKSSLDQIQ